MDYDEDEEEDFIVSLSRERRKSLQQTEEVAPMSKPRFANIYYSEVGWKWLLKDKSHSYTCSCLSHSLNCPKPWTRPRLREREALHLTKRTTPFFRSRALRDSLTKKSFQLGIDNYGRFSKVESKESSDSESSCPDLDRNKSTNNYSSRAYRKYLRQKETLNSLAEQFSNLDCFEKSFPTSSLPSSSKIEEKTVTDPET